MKKNNALGEELLAYWAIITGFYGRALATLNRFRYVTKVNFYAGMKTGQKRLFVFCNVFLSVYITFVVYILNSDILFTGKPRTFIVFFKSIILFLTVYNLIIFLCSRYSSLSISINVEKQKTRKETLLLFGGLHWIILLLSLAASFPGGISPDTENQWLQAHSFAFNNWHPVIHTLLIWLITRIVDHYAFVVFVQITVFSVGVGLLIAVLESWGFRKKFLLAAGLFTTLNPYTMHIMMYPWKDLTLTILITYTSVMVINIYFSEGAWFTKWRNVLSFAFVTGLASLVRHNGFFFTAPLFMLVVLLYKKRTVKALASVALAALVVFLIRVPLYNLIKVTYPHNTYTESVGIPMTILGDVMVKNPQALPPETKEFLNRIASDEQWHKKYIPGYYNTIKHNSNASGIVETIPLETFMKWVLQTCIDANYEAFHAVREVTAIVWNIQKNDFRYGFPIPLVKNELVGVLHSLVSGYMVLLLKIPVISQLFTSIGLLMLLLLLVGIFSLSKNGMAVPLLVVPSICYNLGTMLLLCGPDVRFFHFNVVITLPLLLALFAKISNTLPQTASPGPLGGGQ